MGVHHVPIDIKPNIYTVVYINAIIRKLLVFPNAIFVLF